MVGVWKYGHGCWEAIRDDVSLGFTNKFFLLDLRKKTDGKARLPNVSHRIRRTDYLCRLLHDLEGSASSDKLSGSTTHQPRAGDSADRPQGSTSKDDGASVADPTSSKAPHQSSSKPAKAVKRKAPANLSSSDDEDGSSYESMDEESCKEALRPVKRELKRLKQSTANMSRDEKLGHLKSALRTIGGRVEVIASFEESSSSKERKRKHLWKWTSYFWPTQPVKPELIRKMYDRLAGADDPPVPSPALPPAHPPVKAPRTDDDHPPPAKKPRTTSGTDLPSFSRLPSAHPSDSSASSLRPPPPPPPAPLASSTHARSQRSEDNRTPSHGYHESPQHGHLGYAAPSSPSSSGQHQAFGSRPDPF